MKLLLSISLCFLLISCAASWESTLTKNGKAIKVTITESPTAGIFVHAFDIALNNRPQGTIKLDKREGMKKHTFTPLNTEYGVLTVERNFKYQMTGDNITFDCFLDGDYAGTVQAATGFAR